MMGAPVLEPTALDRLKKKDCADLVNTFERFAAKQSSSDSMMGAPVLEPTALDRLKKKDRADLVNTFERFAAKQSSSDSMMGAPVLGRGAFSNTRVMTGAQINDLMAQKGAVSMFGSSAGSGGGFGGGRGRGGVPLASRSWGGDREGDSAAGECEALLDLPRDERSCSQGHPMELIHTVPFTYRGWCCDVCGATLQPHTRNVLHCSSCQYDVCPNCHTTREPIERCPGGHTLRYVHGRPFEYPGWCCDICKAALHHSTPYVKHCGLCQFDVCSSCHMDTGDALTSTQTPENDPLYPLRVRNASGCPLFIAQGLPPHATEDHVRDRLKRIPLQYVQVLTQDGTTDWCNGNAYFATTKVEHAVMMYHAYPHVYITAYGWTVEPSAELRSLMGSFMGNEVNAFASRVVTLCTNVRDTCSNESLSSKTASQLLRGWCTFPTEDALGNIARSLGYSVSFLARSIAFVFAQSLVKDYKVSASSSVLVSLCCKLQELGCDMSVGDELCKAFSPHYVYGTLSLSQDPVVVSMDGARIPAEWGLKVGCGYSMNYYDKSIPAKEKGWSVEEMYA
eukprot:PhF_6_TR42696/c1_g1_i8/m.64459